MVGFLGCCLWAGGGAGATTPEALAERHVGALVTKSKVLGAALVIQQGAEATTHFFGTTALEGGKPPDGATRFEVGSITKTFTAALLALGVRDGHYRFDTPVAELLGDEAGALTCTLEALAAHHAGVPRLPDNLDPDEAANPYREYDAARLRAFLADYAPGDDTPGYLYSNLGYAVLGHALATAAGTSFEELLAREVFGPLGMARAEVRPGTREPGEWAHPHAPRRLRVTGPAFRETTNWDFDIVAPAGSVAAGIDDMARYLKALIHPEGTPFDGLADELFRQRHDIDGRLGVGLGWHMLRAEEGHAIVWHNGGTGGYSSFLGFVPERETGIVLLTNTANTAAVDGAAVALLEALLD